MQADALWRDDDDEEHADGRDGSLYQPERWQWEFEEDDSSWRPFNQATNAAAEKAYCEFVEGGPKVAQYTSAGVLRKQAGCSHRVGADGGDGRCPGHTQGGYQCGHVSMTAHADSRGDGAPDVSGWRTSRWWS